MRPDGPSDQALRWPFSAQKWTSLHIAAAHGTRIIGGQAVLEMACGLNEPGTACVKCEGFFLVSMARSLLPTPRPSRTNPCEQRESGRPSSQKHVGARTGCGWPRRDRRWPLRGRQPTSTWLRAGALGFSPIALPPPPAMSSRRAPALLGGTVARAEGLGSSRTRTSAQGAAGAAEAACLRPRRQRPLRRRDTPSNNGSCVGATTCSTTEARRQRFGSCWQQRFGSCCSP